MFSCRVRISMRDLPTFFLRCAVVLMCVCPLLSAQNSKENADFKLAINLYNDGLFDLAAEQLRQFVASYPNTPQGIEARFYLGQAQSKLKQFDEARMTFQTFALTYQDNPKAPDAWWNVGESYAAAGNHREAALAFERVKMFHPRSNRAADALVRAGEYFLIAGQGDDARRVLRIVLQEYPSTGAVLAARTQLGKIYFAEGNPEQAQKELKRVIEGNPSPEAKAQALLILGNIAQAMALTDQARNSYEEIIARYPKTSAVQGAYVNLGKLLLARSRHAEAVEQIKKGLAVEGQHDSTLIAEALVTGGDAYGELKDYSNAVQYYNRFVAIFPADTLVPYVLFKSACVNALAGNWTRANELCAQILASDATEWLKKRALGKLGLIAEDQRNVGLAIQLYSGYLDHFPDDATSSDVLFSLGRLAEKEGSLDRAAAYYEQLLTRFPNAHPADALFGAAKCLDGVGEFERALKYYRQSQTNFPAAEYHDEIDERVRRIQTFELKNKDSGIERLALLVGDVLAERDKQGLAYRLGEIYFHDLKNYPAAAAQFTNAINGEVSNDRLADANFLKAKSLEYSSWKDKQYRREAANAYEAFISTHSVDPRINDALLSLFILKANTVDSARAAINDILTSHPTFARKDTMWLTLGMLQLNSDNGQSALASFMIVVEQFPRSPSAEKAGFEMFKLLQGTDLVDSAIAFGDKYIKDHPRGRYTPHIVNELATMMLYEKGEPAHAVKYYQALISEYGYTTYGYDARTKLSEALLAAGNNVEAVELAKGLLQEHENHPWTEEQTSGKRHLVIGTGLQAVGRSAEAKQHLLRCLSEQPSGEQAAKAYNLLGVIYQKEGASEIATSYFRLAGTVAPDAAPSREIADLLFENGNYADAIKQYASLAQAATKESDKRLFEGRRIVSRLRNDDLAGAEKEIVSFMAKFKDADEEIASFELEKGSYYYRKENYVNARKSFDRVVDKYDETSSAPIAMYWIGKILEISNKPQDALKQFEQLQKEYPRSPILPRVYLALGNIHYSAEKWDEAVQNYKKIVDDPNADPELLPYAMSNLIETYETAGVFDAALSLTRKYLELYPNAEDSFDKKVKIGILYQRLGYNDQSVVHLQALLDQAGSDLEGELRYYIAEANYNKGDYQQAILDFLKVPYLVTKKGKIDWAANSLYMSGQSYEKMGRHDQALTMYQQILDRQGIDETFKAAARKEIDRVKSVLKKSSN